MSKKMLVKEKKTEVKIYFNTKLLQPDTENIRATINGLVYANYCSGGDIERLLQGEVRLYFNPLVHQKEDQGMAVRELKKSIMEQDYVFKWTIRPVDASGDASSEEASAADDALDDASEMDEEALS